METLLSLFLYLSFFTYTVSGAENCKPASCSNTGPQVRFPFRLRGHQPQSCGYPGFDLSCNNKTQLVLNLPFSTGEFVVSQINYSFQSIYIVPDFCNRDSILIPINFSTSPFRAQYRRSYTFFNCSSRGSDLFYEPIQCLSRDNNTVIAVPTNFYDFYVRDTPFTCQNISTLEFPAQRGALILQQDFQLTWGPPFCGICELQGGTCGLKNGAIMGIDCSEPPSHGLPTAAKYGIVVGAGIPGLLCLICLLSYTGNRIKAYASLRQQHSIDLPTTTGRPQPVLFIMGLDKPTIQSFPMTVLGESKRLPKPNDSTCAICLSEYQPKDTLRTVPECNHYFHANCIDEWLVLNATCPVCRNSPEGSSSTPTPTSSISSRTSLFST